MRGLVAEAATARLGDADDAVPALAYWLTAVRELFEETGLLLAVDGAGGPSPAGPRRSPTGSRTIAGRWSAASGPSPPSWRRGLARRSTPLAYLSHFITPPSSPIRFSARFFLCPLPAGQPAGHPRGSVGGAVGDTG